MRASARATGGALLLAGVAAACARTAAGRTPPSPARELRVCADPNNLPFSNAKGEGFENRIAELLARDLGAALRYTWRPQRRGFVRTTLNAGACDVVMGVPSGYDPVLTTAPYYRSTYVFVSRADARVRVASLDDPALRTLRVGVHLIGDDYHNPPPVAALAARGIVDNVVGYPIFGDYRDPDPPARLVDAVARREVDVAVVWGPFAGYFAPRAAAPLTVTPLPAAVDSASGQPFVYAISLGVRRGDRARRAALDSLLVRERPAIAAILAAYGVPLAGAATAPAGRVAASRPCASDHPAPPTHEGGTTHATCHD